VTGSDTNPIFEFGSSLPAETYRLDVMALTADGKRAGIANTSSRTV
jgi:hypothetical protein